jgi:hypothetical protein
MDSDLGMPIAGRLAVRDTRHPPSLRHSWSGDERVQSVRTRRRGAKLGGAYQEQRANCRAGKAP